MSIALTHVAGRVGDHNDLAMEASPILAAELARRFGVTAATVGSPTPADPANWDSELDAAMPLLTSLRDRYETLLQGGETPVTALSRCAPAIATLPVVARLRPDAMVVWFDAHGDLNTPENTTTGYLGGLALSGPLGLWDSGLGAGLAMEQAILVGSRDLDPPEQRLVDDGSITLVPVGDDMADHLAEAVCGRPVYIHFDCDVLEPHTVPTDYLVAAGMTLEQLHSCAQALAESEIVGIEIGELETSQGSHDRSPSQLLMSAWEPVFAAITAASEGE